LVRIVILIKLISPPSGAILVKFPKISDSIIVISLVAIIIRLAVGTIVVGLILKSKQTKTTAIVAKMINLKYCSLQ